MEFRISAQDGKARKGKIRIRGKEFNTPLFMPVATAATVKAVGNDDLLECNAEVLMANTFHLHAKTGEETIAQSGGLSKFMNWKGAIMTDSGGFQAFSMGYGMEHGIGKIGGVFPEDNKKKTKQKKLAVIDNLGVKFRSPYDGTQIELTPQKSIQIQQKLDADMILAFDECTSPMSGKEYTTQALRRTHWWAQQCLDEHRKKETGQALFGIVQGGSFKDLRKESAEFIGKLGFEGLAIGGSLGKSKKEMHAILEWVVPLLPKEKPIHLLGIGAIEDIFESVERGIDMFDCVMPTRIARSGHLLLHPRAGGTKKNKFRLDIGNAKHKQKFKAIDEGCGCISCKNYTKAYLRHLYKSGELLYYRLASIHNIWTILKLMEEIRQSIEKGNFQKLKHKWF